MKNKMESLISRGKLTKDFQNLVGKIAQDLVLPQIDATNIEVKIQDKSEETVILDDWHTFGLASEEPNRIIISNLYFSASKRVFHTILLYVLCREVFRRYFLHCCKNWEQYNDLVYVSLNLIAALWLFKEKKIKTLTSPHAGIIRSSLFFKDKVNLRFNDWDRYLVLLFRRKIAGKVVFDKFVELINLAVEKKWPLDKLLHQFRSWLDVLLKDEDFLALPLWVSEREYSIISLLHQMGMKNSSASKIGEKLSLKHDVINSAFRVLYDKYNIYWGCEIDFLSLHLYPYFLRITLRDREFRGMLIEKLQKTPYIKNAYEGRCNDALVITAHFFCPHIIQDKLVNYLENLLKKGYIQNFICSPLKKKTLLSSLTTKKITSSLKTYEQIFAHPEKYQYKTLTLFEKEYKQNQIPKIKKTLFEENILNFISVLRAKFITKGYYMFYVPELFAFCKKNGITVKDDSLMYFINQMDIRCRRLGVLTYFLNIQKLTRHRRSLFFELIEEPQNIHSTGFLSKISFVSNMVIYEFHDRIILDFPRIGFDHPFRIFLEKILINENIPFQTYTQNLLPEIDRYIPYHELYNYATNKWTF
ncbi:MAG: hypothetical protein ACTSWT_10355 [Candidatus Heimdallarchaeota archaeon]